MSHLLQLFTEMVLSESLGSGRGSVRLHTALASTHGKPWPARGPGCPVGSGVSTVGSRVCVAPGLPAVPPTSQPVAESDVSSWALRAQTLRRAVLRWLLALMWYGLVSEV